MLLCFKNAGKILIQYIKVFHYNLWTQVTCLLSKLPWERKASKLFDATKIWRWELIWTQWENWWNAPQTTIPSLWNQKTTEISLDSFLKQRYLLVQVNYKLTKSFKNGDKTSEFEMKLMDLDMEQLGIPEQEYRFTKNIFVINFKTFTIPGFYFWSFAILRLKFKL